MMGRRRETSVARPGCAPLEGSVIPSVIRIPLSQINKRGIHAVSRIPATESWREPTRAAGLRKPLPYMPHPPTAGQLASPSRLMP
jgi:hypothetical protein